MSYNTIRRGPMGGDRFTSVHRHVFRDTRLTPNAACVFGYMSTHAQGWETSVKGIARDRQLGEPLVKAAIACLKKYHYVIYGQDRKADGTVGKGWYFITDLPAQLAELGITDDETVSQRVSEAFEEWLSENEQLATGVAQPTPVTTRTNKRTGTREPRLRSVSNE